MRVIALLVLLLFAAGILPAKSKKKEAAAAPQISLQEKLQIREAQLAMAEATNAALRANNGLVAARRALQDLVTKVQQEHGCTLHADLSCAVEPAAKKK